LENLGNYSVHFVATCCCVQPAGVKETTRAMPAAGVSVRGVGFATAARGAEDISSARLGQ